MRLRANASSFVATSFSSRVVFTSSMVFAMRFSSSLNLSTAVMGILSPQLRAQALLQYPQNFLIKTLNLGVSQCTFARLINDRDRQAVLRLRKRTRFHPVKRFDTDQFRNACFLDCLLDSDVLGPFFQQ